MLEDEAVIREESGGYNSRVFILADVRESNLADRQARFSRISIQLSLHLCQLGRFNLSCNLYHSSTLSRYPHRVAARFQNQ